MGKNLIKPLIVRESGSMVHDVTKIHVDDPGVNNHSILFPYSALKIQLHLWDIFYLFNSRFPTHEEITYCDKILITPDSADWDLYSSHFDENAESILYW